MEKYKTFRYESDVCWKSGRTATICSSGKPDLDMTCPPEFKGETGLWTPEDMFVASVNACTLMTFLAYAEHKGLQLQGYESAAEGVLEKVDGKYRFTEISLRPHLMLKSEQDIPRAREILDEAHKDCLLINSVTAGVRVFPDFHVTTETNRETTHK
jgi:organic hydroperoxide reductase OsmC/OhrA